MKSDEPNHGDNDCLREIARILAAGILRLHRRAALPVEGGPEKREDSAPNCLEVPDKSRLSGHGG
jgi:hypothetical protein